MSLRTLVTRSHYPLLALIALATTSCVANADRQGPQTLSNGASSIHYEVTGSGPKSIALVHGWASDHHAWWKNVPLLAEHYRVIAIDLPGHGESSEPTQPYSMDLFADGIAAVLEAEQIDSTVLVGHSNGVPTVRQFYRKHPDKVEKLVLIDGALKNVVPPSVAEQVRPLFESEDYAATVERFVSSMPAPNLTDEDRAVISTMARRQPQHAVIGGFSAAVDPVIWEQDPIRVPVLMINARQPSWDKAYEEYVERLVPDLDYRVIEGAGHFIMVEKPVELAIWIREFVER